MVDMETTDIQATPATPVKLEDIARHTGLSRHTVGRVLGGKAHLHKESTVRRIQEAAAEMGYRPNLIARSVRSGRTQTVGVMIPVGNDSFTADMIVGAHDALLEHDYLPVMLLARPGVTELEQIHRFIDRRVDGIILQPSGHDVSDAYLHEPLERNIPVVTVNRAVSQTRFIDYAGTHDELGGRLAAEHLYALGHRRIACVSRRGAGSEMALRVSGFRDFLDSQPDAVCSPVPVAFPDQDVMDCAPLRQLLSTTDRPTAVFATMDPLAPGLYALAAELGLSIPGDLSVVGFADLDYARFLSPALTTLRQDGQEIGRRAARLLMDRLDERVAKDEVRRVRVEPELVVRGSTTVPGRRERSQQ